MAPSQVWPTRNVGCQAGAAPEMLETDGIFMTSVDTGWITNEQPHAIALRLADEVFHAPA